MTRTCLVAAASLLALAAGAKEKKLPDLPSMPPALPAIDRLPSLDEIDPEVLRDKSLCVFPFIKGEGGSADAARGKYQESLQTVFYEVAKASPILKDPVFLKRPPACGMRDVECISGIGAFSKCEHVLVGSSTPVDNGFALSVRLIDVETKKVAAKVDEVVVTDKESEVAAWAEGHACRALKVECKGEVMLDLDRPDMVAVIDRRPVPRKPGITGGESVEVGAGLHSIRVSIGRRSSLPATFVVRREGQPAKVSARQLADCAIPLIVSGELHDTVPQPASVECRGTPPQRIVGIALAAAGVIAGGIAAYEIGHGRVLVNQASASARQNGGAYYESEAAKLDSGQSNIKLGRGLLLVGIPLLAAGAVLTTLYW